MLFKKSLNKECRKHSICRFTHLQVLVKTMGFYPLCVNIKYTLIPIFWGWQNHSEASVHSRILLPTQSFKMEIQNNGVSSTVPDKDHSMSFTIITHFKKMSDFSVIMLVHSFGFCEKLLGDDQANLDFIGKFVDCTFEKISFTEMKVTMHGTLEQLREGRNMIERLVAAVQNRLNAHLASLHHTDIEILICKRSATCGECEDDSFLSWLHLKDHVENHFY